MNASCFPRTLSHKIAHDYNDDDDDYYVDGIKNNNTLLKKKLKINFTLFKLYPNLQIDYIPLCYKKLFAEISVSTISLQYLK